MLDFFRKNFCFSYLLLSLFYLIFFIQPDLFSNDTVSVTSDSSSILSTDNFADLFIPKSGADLNKLEESLINLKKIKDEISSVDKNDKLNNDVKKEQLDSLNRKKMVAVGNIESLVNKVGKKQGAFTVDELLKRYTSGLSTRNSSNGLSRESTTSSDLSATSSIVESVANPDDLFKKAAPKPAEEQNIPRKQSKPEPVVDRSLSEAMDAQLAKQQSEIDKKVELAREKSRDRLAKKTEQNKAIRSTEMAVQTEASPIPDEQRPNSPKARPPSAPLIAKKASPAPDVAKEPEDDFPAETSPKPEELQEKPSVLSKPAQNNEKSKEYPVVVPEFVAFSAAAQTIRELEQKNQALELEKKKAEKLAQKAKAQAEKAAQEQKEKEDAERVKAQEEQAKRAQEAQVKKEQEEAQRSKELERIQQLEKENQELKKKAKAEEDAQAKKEQEEQAKREQYDKELEEDVSVKPGSLRVSSQRIVQARTPRASKPVEELLEDDISTVETKLVEKEDVINAKQQKKLLEQAQNNEKSKEYPVVAPEIIPTSNAAQIIQDLQKENQEKAATLAVQKKQEQRQQKKELGEESLAKVSNESNERFVLTDSQENASNPPQLQRSAAQRKIVRPEKKTAIRPTELEEEIVRESDREVEDIFKIQKSPRPAATRVQSKQVTASIPVPELPEDEVLSAGGELPEKRKPEQQKESPEQARNNMTIKEYPSVSSEFVTYSPDAEKIQEEEKKKLQESVALAVEKKKSDRAAAKLKTTESPSVSGEGNSVVTTATDGLINSVKPEDVEDPKDALKEANPASSVDVANSEAKLPQEQERKQQNPETEALNFVENTEDIKPAIKIESQPSKIQSALEKLKSKLGEAKNNMVRVRDKFVGVVNLAKEKISSEKNGEPKTTGSDDSPDSAPETQIATVRAEPRMGESQKTGAQEAKSLQNSGEEVKKMLPLSEDSKNNLKSLSEKAGRVEDSLSKKQQVVSSLNKSSDPATKGASLAAKFIKNTAAGAALGNDGRAARQADRAPKKS